MGDELYDVTDKYLHPLDYSNAWHPLIGVGKLLLFIIYVKLLGGVVIEAPKKRL